MDSQTPTKNSSSYIKVWCSDDADPKCNRLQLDTTPPTYIELQPGLNILTVEDYPDLKHGFFQVDDEDGNWDSENGHDIQEFDLSNFDGTELVSMCHMFAWMAGVKKITFGYMATPVLNDTDSTFYRTGEDAKMEMLNLRGVNFSKVTNAYYMFHGIKTAGINLTDADFSNLTNAEGMFDECEIDHLILDNIKFPKDLLELIFEDLARCSDIKKISLKGWDQKNIKTAIEIIENNFDNTDNLESGLQYELNPNLEYSLTKNEEGIIECSITDRDEIFISRYRYSFVPAPAIGIKPDAFIDELFPKLDFNYFLHQELKNSGIEIEMDYTQSEYCVPESHRNFDSIYSSKIFPTPFIKLSEIAWKNHLKKYPEKKDSDYEPTFIIGNHYFALTNNDKFKFYVPDLKQGYENINDVLAALDETINGDISNVKIICTEYLDMGNLPTVIKCNGKIWSPYQEPGFDMTDIINKKRFGELIKTRREQRNAYIHVLLDLISKADYNKKVLCCDIDGNHHIINTAEILTISSKDIDSQKLTAEIKLRDRVSIEVDLEDFAKIFVNHESNKAFHLPESLQKETGIVIHIIQPIDTESYLSIWEESVKKYRVYVEEQKKHLDSSKLSKSEDNFHDDEDDFEDLLKYYDE